MQLENLAVPVEVDSPHRRYAALHRAIDSGMASDATWRELVDVCLLLGHQDEALRAFRRLSGQAHRDVEAMLIHRGLLRAGDSNAQAAEETPPKPGLREDTIDAARVLFEDHMPLTTAVATLTFPLVVGLGGFLTAGHSFFLFPLIAALPALCVVGIVGALSRGILLDSAHGIHDVPRIPGSAALIKQAGRFLLDSLVLLGALAGPAIAMGYLGLALSTTLAAAAIAAVLLPMALLMRQITDDWRALSPNYLFRAIGRLGSDYLGRAAVCTGIFLPAALAAVATAGSHLYLQVSVVGPLLVAPLFVAARLLGRLVDSRRDDLLDLLDLPARKRSSVVTVAEASAAAQRATPKPASPRPASTRGSGSRGAVRPAVASTVGAPAPAARPRPTSVPVKSDPRARPELTDRPAARGAPATQPTAAQPTASQPTVNRPAPNRPAAPTTPTRTAAQPRPAPASPQRPTSPQRPAPTEHPAPTTRGVFGTRPKSSVSPPAPAPAPAARIEVSEDPLPDFTAMSGFHIVQGKARVLAGASSTSNSGRHRPQP